MDAPEPPSPRTTLRRKADRARYDRSSVEAIVDAGFVCHVGFVDEHGPVVLPTAYGRLGDHLYLHGAPAAGWLRAARTGAPLCVTITLVDGVVLARSAFHHSLNYRSVVIYGAAEEVRDLAEKRRALEQFVDHVAPGRAVEARPPTDRELKATAVVSLPITEASAKVRAGGPVDDPDDLGLAVWAGHVPLRTVPGAPVADDGVPESVAVPDSLRSLGDRLAR